MFEDRLNQHQSSQAVHYADTDPEAGEHPCTLETGSQCVLSG